MVLMTDTGRIVIPKKMRELLEIKKGDVIFYEQRVPGYILASTEETADNKLIERMRHLSKSNLKKYFEEDWGFCLVEEKFRIFIPKSYRIFASIDICRESSSKKVLMALLLWKQFEIWAPERWEHAIKMSDVLWISESEKPKCREVLKNMRLNFHKKIEPELIKKITKK